MSDTLFMQEALRLAERGMFSTHPNPRVGCVVVQGQQVVGRGAHIRAGEPHAEVFALQEAGGQAKGATVYVTLEPCSHHGRTPPCADTLIAAGVARVVVAMQDPNPRVAGQGIRRLQDHGIEVLVGVLEQQARALNPGFIRQMEEHLPYIRCKMAASLDGRTAMANGESQWITGEESRADVQYWRARSSIVLTGIGTVLMDKPSLQVRTDMICDDRPLVQPLRGIVDSRLSLPLDAPILEEPEQVIVFTRQANSPKTDALRSLGVRVVFVADAPEGSGLDLNSIARWLAENQYHEVLLESGAVLAGAMARAGLVQQFIFYLAPIIMGSDARPLLDWPLASMADRQKLDIVDIKRFGEDIRIIAQPNFRNQG